MDCITVPASLEHLEKVQDFVIEHLESYDCPMKVMMQIEIAVEEIFVNIANYAYYPETGTATVCCEVRQNPRKAVIQFIDQGRPFNPLDREDAETTQEALLGREGGLGILMVKKTMDSVRYCHEDDKNILTISKIMEE